MVFLVWFGFLAATNVGNTSGAIIVIVCSGLGKEAADAIWESGLADFLKGRDVFERLYRDALDRMRRYAEAQQRHLEETSKEFMRQVQAMFESPLRKLIGRQAILDGPANTQPTGFVDGAVGAHGDPGAYSQVTRTVSPGGDAPMHQIQRMRSPEPPQRNPLQIMQLHPPKPPFEEAVDGQGLHVSGLGASARSGLGTQSFGQPTVSGSPLQPPSFHDATQGREPSVRKGQLRNPPTRVHGLDERGDLPPLELRGRYIWTPDKASRGNEPTRDHSSPGGRQGRSLSPSPDDKLSRFTGMMHQQSAMPRVDGPDPFTIKRLGGAPGLDEQMPASPSSSKPQKPGVPMSGFNFWVFGVSFRDAFFGLCFRVSFQQNCFSVRCSCLLLLLLLALVLVLLCVFICYVFVVWFVILF